MKPCSPKRNAELALDWDRLALERQRQIASGDDLSFHHVIVPKTLELLKGCNLDVVLDIGSGTGEFTRRLAEISQKLIALEPSHASTTLAREVCKSNNNVAFLEMAVEDAVVELSGVGATCAIALMSLMTAPDLYRVATSLSNIMKPPARFVAILTHPYFWPKYRGYDEAAWFRYENEIFIESPFVISKCKTDITTTHIHRPLQQYISVFSLQGFSLEGLIEPVPNMEVQALYPTLWHFPRFIGLKWQRV